ncbi:MAG: hypothetical protein A2X47_04500 [Lentisphaerae bacterium GWF2_38_69]|nr:MAG: hypothetical protein A2X47_04500 [Lentisphaerae bacterium GWF2_38_69]
MIIFLRIMQSVGLGLYIMGSSMVIKNIMTEREQIRATGLILSGLVLSPAISPVIGAAFILLALLCSSSLLIAGMITFGAILMRGANALVNTTTQVITINRFKNRGGVALGMAISAGIEVQGISVILVTLFHSKPLEGLVIISIVLSAIGIITFHLIRENLNYKA